MSGAQCWSMLLTELALSSSYSKANLCEWKSILLRPHRTPFLPQWPLHSWAHGAMTGIAGGKKADCPQNESSYLLELLLSGSHRLVSEHVSMTHVYSYPLPIYRDLSTSSPDVFLTKFLVILPSSP